MSFKKKYYKLKSVNYFLWCFLSFLFFLGNTRALFCKSENGTLHVNQLSVDHTVSNDDELRRLLHLGLDVEKLKIVRKLGKSENTRCIGDYSVKAGYKDIENLR